MGDGTETKTLQVSIDLPTATGMSTSDAYKCDFCQAFERADGGTGTLLKPYGAGQFNERLNPYRGGDGPDLPTTNTEDDVIDFDEKEGAADLDEAFAELADVEPDLPFDLDNLRGAAEELRELRKWAAEADEKLHDLAETVPGAKQKIVSEMRPLFDLYEMLGE